MDTKKVVIVLLVIAIAFSVLTVVMNFNDGGFVGNPSGFSGDLGGNQINAQIFIPNLFLGVFDGI